MKKTLTLGTFILGCFLAAPAQTSGYYQIPSRAAAGYSQDAFAPPAMSANQSAQKTTVEGCLSQSVDGIFILSDAAGSSYQLNDGASRLSQFVGKVIRVDGFGLFNSTSESGPGAMSAEPMGPAQQIDVTRVRKIADRCQKRTR